MSNQIQGFQLSPQQHHLWLQQDSSVYRALGAILIRGNLQVDALKSALQKVVDRNEILRTNFHYVQGIKGAVQVINNPRFLFEEKCLDEFCLEYKSINDLKAAKSKYLDVFEKIMYEQKQQSFNWKNDCLFSTTLLKLDANEYILVVSLPALCADVVALDNLAGEISRCYTACLQHEEILEEPLQYADIAAWQNELLEVEETDAGKKYWQKIDTSNIRCKLFSEHQGENTEFNPKFISLVINQEVIGEINAISQSYQVSFATVLLTCWYVLLWRLTKQKLIIGTAFDGRNYNELKAALGLFAKYLPFTCQLQEENCFGDVLVKMQNIITEMSEVQESFSWEIVQETNESFFPFCFEFRETPTQYTAQDISLAIYQQYVCFDRFKIKLCCDRTPDNDLKAEFHYDSNLFATADIQLLASQFETLLTSVRENPQAAIAQLDMLSPREQKQLLHFNDTTTPAPPYECIHSWFTAQCDRTPDNIAVVFAQQQLTYRELNTRANQLAHYLQQLGVGAEILVGLCIERSLEMIIGLLGIIKAGAAYVPIDPNYPSERKAFIIADTQMPLLLTTQRLAKDLPTDNLKLICLDSNRDRIAKQSSENPVSNVTALNLAYVIYTSGSTGKPKGTLIPHQGLVNYLNWCIQAYPVTQGSGTLVHSSIGFDLTITSLFSPLLVGNQVELLPDESIENLSITLQQRTNLSLVKITPAHLELLSQQLSLQQAANRTRALIIGGENLTTQHTAFWQNFAPDTILINEYGPTETVVGCCIYQVPPERHHSGSIPIGHPIANTQLYVLDTYLNPVPLGVAGELYIGGVGVARGYLNQPELTAQKFIPNCFNHQSGERLYKTGDRVRFRQDGSLEYLGRLDDQVKIRGFRIELGEIEAVLLQYHAIADAVAIAREDIIGDQRLVAYLVFNQQSASVDMLRSFLKEKLPEYMIPTAFVCLQTLPLTPNGKVDRQALPVPEQINTVAELLIAPRNSTESQLANIWTQLLRIEKVGIHNNFFNLGGHSLLVTQLISRIRDAFGVELLVQQVFATPTVAELAAIITQKLATQADEEILARSLAELEELSDNEVRLILADSKQSIGG